MKNIFSVIFIVIAIGVFFMFVTPLYKETQELRSNVLAYNQALSNSTNLEKTRDSLIQKYNQVTDAEKKRLEHFLPNTVDNIQLILELQKMAGARNMPLKNIKFDNPSTTPDSSSGKNGSATISGNTLTPVNPYGTFNLEFTTTAEYSTFVSFLSDLEHNLRLINIKSISFNPPTNSSKVASQANPNVYNFNVKIETYWLKN